jgi:hypothetical protein
VEELTKAVVESGIVTDAGHHYTAADLSLLTEVTWKPNLSVDVTKEFPFLLTKLPPYYGRQP